MVSRLTIKDYTPRYKPMTLAQVRALIDNIKLDDNGSITNVALVVDGVGSQVDWVDSLFPMMEAIGKFYHFTIQEKKKNVLETTGRFFRSILVQCPHCGDEIEYDAEDGERLMHTEYECKYCDERFRITRIDSELMI